ncbi:MAG: hypothetical protein ACR2KZ_19200, partial [Segetibacter sp.]
IGRPDYRELNPFVNTSDPKTSRPAIVILFLSRATGTNWRTVAIWVSPVLLWLTYSIVLT